MTYFQGIEINYIEAVKVYIRDKVHTVFLGCHFKSHVLLFELLVRLLQVTDVVDGFSQHCRLVELKKNEIKFEMQ